MIFSVGILVTCSYSHCQTQSGIVKDCDVQRSAPQTEDSGRWGKNGLAPHFTAFGLDQGLPIPMKVMFGSYVLRLC